MHGNTVSTASGLKTRNFVDILAEIESSFAVHRSVGSELGGIHFKRTGEDVTKCIGSGLTEAELDRNYASLCDPRLKYRQALRDGVPDRPLVVEAPMTVARLCTPHARY